MRKILFLVLYIFLSASLHSQLVNIEKERKSHKQGFQGFISFSFDITQNTSKIIQGSNTANFQFIKNKHTFLVLNDYSIMKVIKNQDNFDLKNKNFQHFRYNYSIVDTNKISIEYFVQRQQNKLKFLELRFITGTGPRFKIINSPKFNFFIAPLFMYEYEVLTDSLNTNTKMLKGDFYISCTIKLSDSLYFSNVTYYQPAFANFNNYSDFERFYDFRLFSDFSFSFEIFKNLEYSLSFESSYDSRPPSELIDKPFFYDLSNRLTYKF